MRGRRAVHPSATLAAQPRAGERWDDTVTAWDQGGVRWDQRVSPPGGMAGPAVRWYTFNYVGTRYASLPGTGLYYEVTVPPGGDYRDPYWERWYEFLYDEGTTRYRIWPGTGNYWKVP